MKNRGEGVDETWWWDYLDLKAKNTLEVVLDDNVEVYRNLTGREIITILFCNDELGEMNLTEGELLNALIGFIRNINEPQLGINLSIKEKDSTCKIGDTPPDDNFIVRRNRLSEGPEIEIKLFYFSGVKV